MAASICKPSRGGGRRGRCFPRRCRTVGCSPSHRTPAGDRMATGAMPWRKRQYAPGSTISPGAVSSHHRFVIVFTRADAHARWPALKAISHEKRQPSHSAEEKNRNYRPSTRGNFRYIARNVKAEPITVCPETERTSLIDLSLACPIRKSYNFARYGAASEVLGKNPILKQIRA